MTPRGPVPAQRVVLTTPMLPVGTKAKFEVLEHEDYVGRKLVQRDPERNRPVQSLEWGDPSLFMDFETPETYDFDFGGDLWSDPSLRMDSETPLIEDQSWD